jgi:hypothetical protein
MDKMTPTPMMLGCGMPGGDGSFTCSGMNLTSTMWTLTSWNMTLDPDPYVNAITALRNDSAATQTFFLNVVLPLSVVKGPPLVISGSIQGGVTDADGVAVNVPLSLWAQASSAGGPIYRAAVDGSVVQTLLNHPVSANVNQRWQSGSFTTSGFSSVVLPGNTASTSIAIYLRFNLSPGDTASFTSVFNVVPEPSTAVLAGLGLLGLLVVGRRAARR